MVQVTLELIAKTSSTTNKKRYEETLEQFAKRVTHLYLENKNIDSVGDDLPLCRSVSVLYLYDNLLVSVPDLSANTNLTHIYLQNNRIRRMDNLQLLPKLSKLYLGGNEITVVEGLESLSCLTELHVENQRLPPGEKLLFDPRSLLMLGQSLQSLNVAGNRIDDLLQFECLFGLVHFDCSENAVDQLDELGVCLRGWRRLERLQLSGNPVCARKKYRDQVVVLSDSLTELDGKQVSDSSRIFLRRMQQSKDRRKESGHTSSSASGSTTTAMRDPVAAAAVAGGMLPSLPSKHFDSVLQRQEPTLLSRSQSDKRGTQPRLIAM